MITNYVDWLLLRRTIGFVIFHVRKEAIFKFEPERNANNKISIIKNNV